MAISRFGIPISARDIPETNLYIARGVEKNLRRRQRVTKIITVDDYAGIPLSATSQVYSDVDVEEAVRLFTKRYGKPPKRVYRWRWYWYCEVEDEDNG